METINVDVPAVTSTGKTYEISQGQAAAYGGGLIALGTAVGFAIGFMRGKMKGKVETTDEVKAEASKLKKGMDSLREIVEGMAGKKEKPVEGEVIEAEVVEKKTTIKEKHADGGKEKPAQ